MKDINDICFILSCRVNSTRIIKKMIRPFGETNLFEIAIKKILALNVPKKNIYIAIGDKELIDIAKKYDVNIFYRSDKSINSSALNINECFEWCNEFSKKFKYFFWMNGCQPFLKVDTINKFINTFINSNNKSIITVNKIKNYFWDNDKKLNKDNFIHNNMDNFAFNTKYVNPTYAASHSMQLGLLSELVNGTWLGTFEKDDPELFFVEEEESFDIDYPWQFEMAELKYKNIIQNN